MNPDTSTPAPDVTARPDATKPTLTVVIVSYETGAMTAAAIESVLATTRNPMELIVVDNGSSDGSADMIARRFPAVRLMRQKENLGFGRATNLAAAVARGRYLLLLNSDTVALPGAVDALLAEAGATPEARIWGGRTVFADGQLNPTSCWRRPTLWSIFCATAGLSRLAPRSALFNPEAYPGWDRATAREVDIVTGCLLLIEKSFWDELGGFDPAYFLYGEEADLCLRARARGARPRITPEATIIHHVGASETDGALRRMQLLAGRIANARRHLPRGQRGLAVALLRAGAFLRMTGLDLRARLTGRTAGAEDGRRVWRERKVWWHGYGAGAGRAAGAGAAPGPARRRP